MRPPLRRLGFSALAAPLLALAACGDLPLPSSPTPVPLLAAATVSLLQTGNAPVTIDPSSASYALDPNRALKVSAALTSNAGVQTVTVRCTLYARDGSIIGDATSGRVTVPTGVPTRVMLGGPAPLGPIARATFEVSTPAP